jgi:hypothetical protein
LTSLDVVVAVVALGAGGQLLARGLNRRMGRAIEGPAPPGAQPGQTVIALHPAYWALFAGSLALAILFLVAAFATDDARLRSLGPIAVALSGPGALFMFHELRLRVVLDDEGLAARAPWQRPVRLRWADISTVAFSSILTSFVLRDREGKRLRVPILGRGIGTLTEQLRSRLAEPVWRQAVDEYQRVMRQVK